MISSTSSNLASDALLRQNTARRVTVIRSPSISLSGLRNDLLKLAQYRDLLYTLSMHRVKVRYKQSLLGISWAILQPLALMLIYTAVFQLIAKMPSDGAPYALFVYTAILVWTYFSTALTNAINGLVSHSDIITKVYFPREILPLTYVAAALFDFLVASSVLSMLLLYYRISLTINVLYIIPIMLVLTFFVTAIALFFSATHVRFRDIGVAVPLLLQLWMFATPVVYPLNAVPERLRPFYQLNPMAGVIENFRRVILQGAPPDFYLLSMSALLSTVLLVASYVYFKNVEATIADII